MGAPAHTSEAFAGAKGTMTAGGLVFVMPGEDQEFHITPDQGFPVAYIIVNGKQINLEDDSDRNADAKIYSFVDAVSDHIIEAGFSIFTSEVQFSTYLAKK